MGRYEPRTSENNKTRQTYEYAIAGDKENQKRVVYENPPLALERADNIVYDQKGLARHGSTIIEKYSVRAPGIKQLLFPRATNNLTQIPQGTIIESATPVTYGDWIGDFIRAMVCCPNFPEPLIIPAFLGTKEYVRRDLERLDVHYLIAEEPVLIEKASILRRQLPSYYWGIDEVAAYKSAFDIAPPLPRPGSILYLGRFGLKSEVVDRTYPSTATARLVKELGGKVFDTAFASPKAFDKMAPFAETIIADQGSELFGTMHWRTKNVIELTTDWWHNSSLFVARASGVENYAVIDIDHISIKALDEKIKYYLDAFGVLRPQNQTKTEFAETENAAIEQIQQIDAAA